MFFIIVHGQKSDAVKPFVHITGDRNDYEKYVKGLQEDIDAGGEGILHWHGESDNIDFHKVWVMPFNK